MMGWVILMGLPVLFFRPPLGPQDLKLFLGVFYAQLLFVGTVIMRMAGTRWLLVLAFPFLVLFTGLAMRTFMDQTVVGWDKATSLNFLAVYAVLFLCWRLGRRLAPITTE
jgi:hypothetical protein